MICVEDELQQTPFDFGCSMLHSLSSTTNQSEADIMFKRKTMSEETKRKIGLANKGRKFPPEYGQRISELYKTNPNMGMKGKPRSEETKKKISLSNWKRGKGFIISHGYILILKKDHPYTQSYGYVYKHRLVMEEHLGRYLKPEEVVHHINGNLKDNRIENLKLYPNNGKHMIKHMLGNQYAKKSKRF